MAVEFNKTSHEGNNPDFWRGEAKILPGGFILGQTLPVGSVVRRGTPLYIEDEPNRKAYICKSAYVTDGSDADALQVAKGHFFAVGDLVTTAGDTTAQLSATPRTITAINTSNAGYDVLSLAADITGLSNNKGTIVEAGGSTHLDLGKSKYEPNAVVGSDAEIDGRGVASVDVAFEGVVLRNMVKAPIASIWLTGGISMKNNHSIKFIIQ